MNISALRIGAVKVALILKRFKVDSQVIHEPESVQNHLQNRRRIEVESPTLTVPIVVSWPEWFEASVVAYALLLSLVTNWLEAV